MTAEVRPIRSETDYETALAEVERLWGAKLGTPEGDRLDVLATLIDAYEAEHHPMDPPDPVEAILFRMDRRYGVPTDRPGSVSDRVYEHNQQIYCDELGFTAEDLVP